MPIVFVHGVNNRRSDPDYDKNELSRNAFLKTYVGPQLFTKTSKQEVLSPYWGVAGVTFAWNMAVLPGEEKTEAFGAAGHDALDLAVAAEAAENNFNGDLASLARDDLRAAIELLFTAAMVTPSNDTQALEIAAAYAACMRYADANPKPEWLAKANHQNFGDYLLAAANPASDVESFGAGLAGLASSLKEAAARLAGLPKDLASSLLSSIARKKLNASATRFVGDAFQYIAKRGSEKEPGEIVKIVLNVLRKAQVNAKDGEPLIVIAHSFGGEIVYDILTHFDVNLRVDVLVTVGSQVGLFEEMKQFHASRPEIAVGQKVPKPRNVCHWLNVFDPNDPFSYLCEPVFEGVEDYLYDTGYGSLKAHGGYFRRPSFYQKLAKRLSAFQKPQEQP